MAQQSTEVKAPSGLRPWIIAFALIFPPIAWFFNQVIQGLTPWWVFAGILPLPMLLNIVIFFVLSQISPRFRISRQEWACLTTILWLVGGAHFLETGIDYWTTNPLPTYNIAYFLTGQFTDPYRAVFAQKMPSILAPKAADVINSFYYGGTFDWGAWSIPIAFWITWSIALYCGGFLWTFAFRKPQVEVERLPFAFTLPSTYPVLWATEEEGGKTRLFNFSLGLSKLFWLGTLIGAIACLPNAISALTPIPLPNYVFSVPFDLTPFTRGVLPGAMFTGYFPPVDIMAASLCPLDVLATTFVWWIAFGILFPVIGIRAGVLPYTPGDEVNNPWASSIGPFKAGTFTQLGVSVGLGVWVIWRYRSYWMHMLRVTFNPKKFKPEDSEDQGVKYNLVVIGGILAFVVVVILFVLGGAPISMAIAGPIFYIIYMYGWMRIDAEGGVYIPDVSTYQGAYFDIGTFFGQWGARPDPNAFNASMMYASFGSGSRMASYNMAHQFMSYKIGDLLNTRARDILLTSLITMISIAVVSIAVWPLWYTRLGGYTRGSAVEYDVWAIPTPWSYTYGTPTLPGTAETWSYIVLGTITVFACNILRSRFTWFFLTPVGMCLAGGNISWWPVWVFAFILKYAVTKIGGARLYEHAWIPIVCGFVGGTGITFVLTSWVAFFTRGLPTLMSRL